MAAEQTTIRIGRDDEAALAAFAAGLAAVLTAGDVLFLFGGLGAGKTTLTQHLARALGVGDEQYVSSPTFALLHTYEGRLPVHHMDCYRLAGEDDVEDAGLADALETDGVALVEWPERLGALAPLVRLVIHLEVEADGARRVSLQPRGERWRRSLSDMARALNTFPSANH
ncbi:MAG: tRNA (adenosine(37)-N6)-threonylcarbamoyltransferase complex ATPase subunit type 1 TsaE [Desulfobulbus sp.]|jgi:tRNA threonylcarbamoyladenosine biosynthesis protein TsaE|nr:tRNA (adenosine(37)-N6)-threonylcarbamoyltransferase complex ATPase subunit type 1 TsaE [Desulfobulbus sp.]